MHNSRFPDKILMNKLKLKQSQGGIQNKKQK